MANDDLRSMDLLLGQARLVIQRLERLPADSRWAHRASGCRGSLLRLVTELEQPGARSGDLGALRNVLLQSYAILNAAARERLR